MDTLPLRHAKKQDTPSQLSSHHRVGQSQTTIDFYLRPLKDVKTTRNDIRNYFPPVTKTRECPDEILSTSSFPKNMPGHKLNGAAKDQTPDPSLCPKSQVDSTTSLTEIRELGKAVRGNIIRAPKHNHVKSDVLPRFDPFLDDEDFLHSSSPMAPRVTDIMRYSLLPKPLNIKLPPPSAEVSRSPSPTTSSASSVGDPDTLSLYGERLEAPSFKQTYLSVHSHQHSKDSPVSPLTALRSPSPKTMRRHMDRPTTMRSMTAPKLSQPYSNNSVIYFLPEISPTLDSSVGELEPLISTNNQKTKDKTSFRDVFRAKRRAAKLEKGNPVQTDSKKMGQKEKDVTVSPGLQKYYDYLASRDMSTPTGDEGNEREKSDRRRKENMVHTELPGSRSASKKNKKGKGLKRLMEAYSKHVEGLQMIQ